MAGSSILERFKRGFNKILTFLGKFPPFRFIADTIRNFRTSPQEKQASAKKEQETAQLVNDCINKHDIAFLRPIATPQAMRENPAQFRAFVEIINILGPTNPDILIILWAKLSQDKKLKEISGRKDPENLELTRSISLDFGFPLQTIKIATKSQTEHLYKMILSTNNLTEFVPALEKPLTALMAEKIDIQFLGSDQLTDQDKLNILEAFQYLSNASLFNPELEKKIISGDCEGLNRIDFAKKLVVEKNQRVSGPQQQDSELPPSALRPSISTPPVADAPSTEPKGSAAQREAPQAREQEEQPPQKTLQETPQKSIDQSAPAKQAQNQQHDKQQTKTQQKKQTKQPTLSIMDPTGRHVTLVQFDPTETFEILLARLHKNGHRYYAQQGRIVCRGKTLDLKQKLSELEDVLKANDYKIHFLPSLPPPLILSITDTDPDNQTTIRINSASDEQVKTILNSFYHARLKTIGKAIPENGAIPTLVWKTSGIEVPRDKSLAEMGITASSADLQVNWTLRKKR